MRQAMARLPAEYDANCWPEADWPAMSHLEALSFGYVDSKVAPQQNTSARNAFSELFRYKYQ